MCVTVHGFFGFERNSKRFVVESTQYRDPNTLEEIIQCRIRRGSIVIGKLTII